MISRLIRAAALFATLAIVSSGCTSGGGASPSVASSVASSAAAPSGGSSCPTVEPAALPAGETRTVTISTNLGDIVIGIKADLSPIAAGNFVALAQCGFYDGVGFHRLVPGFVIQGGDPDGTGTGGPGYTIADEPVTETYARGVVAMARTQQPDSVGSQFFIVLDDEARGALESANTYQIIGTVTGGMDTVDAIAATPNSGEPNNAAIDPVVMTDVSVSNP
ncbi:MAG: peptidylprolyl isomerase [Candidatus Limnocylindrales bacterium]